VAFSTAHVRSGNCSAHFDSRSSCLGPDRTRSSATLRSPASTATAVCDPLCGSTPIITVTGCSSSLSAWKTVVGMSDCSSVSARSRLFRARPRRDPTAGTSFGSQAATATGRRFVSPAIGISRQYERAAPSWWTLNQTGLCTCSGAPDRGAHLERSAEYGRVRQ
jgi:hypothetical protein